MRKIYIGSDRCSVIKDISKLRICNFKIQEPIPTEKLEDYVIRENYRMWEDNLNQASTKDTFFDTSEISKGGMFSGKFQKFTKLPFIYLDLKHGKGILYPFIFVRDKEGCERFISSAGHGRLIICKKYFPQIKINYAKHCREFGVGGEEIIDRYIEWVKSSEPWKNKDTSNLIAKITLDKSSKNSVFIKQFEFVTEEYWNNYRRVKPDYFLEKSADIELIRRQEKSFRELDPSDMDNALDRLVLDHLDYCESIYDWAI
jgi:hypothetical protein|tara:strand:- start:209 stop:982 length:774 start_codon:yes stop_codon:yes gene_type:complete